MNTKTKIVFIVIIVLSAAAIAGIYFLNYKPAEAELNSDDLISMKDSAAAFEQKPGNGISQAVPIELNKLYSESLSREMGENSEDYYLLPSVSTKTVRVAIWLPDEKPLEHTGAGYGKSYYISASVYSGTNGNMLASSDANAEDQGRTAIFELKLPGDLSNDETCVLKFESEHNMTSPYYFCVGADLSASHTCDYKETVYDNGAKVRICKECGSIDFPRGGMRWIAGIEAARKELKDKTLVPVAGLSIIIFVSLVALLVLSPIISSTKKKRAAKAQQAAEEARKKAEQASATRPAPPRPRAPRVVNFRDYKEFDNSTVEDRKLTVAYYEKKYKEAIKNAEDDHGVSGVWNGYTVPEDLDYSNLTEVRNLLYGIDRDTQLAFYCKKFLGPQTLGFVEFDKVAAMEPLERSSYSIGNGLNSDYGVSRRPSSSDEGANRDKETIANIKDMSDFEVYLLANDRSASDEVRSAAQSEDHWRTTNKWID